MDNNEIICISSINEMTEGLFGEVILFICEILPILELSNIDINNLKWDIATINYGNIFPSILEYNSEYVNPDTIKNKKQLFYYRSLKPQYALGDDFTNLNKLFFKYFKIPDRIQEYVNNINLDNCLGIHFRGTDKTNDIYMNTMITIQDFMIIIDSYLQANTHITKIFLATDENIVYEYLKTTYKHIEIITSRNLNQNLFWRHNQDIYRNAFEAMVDMLCLSKCKIVLKVSSALSAFSKVINPNLEIYRLNATIMCGDIPYFADSYIPLLKTNKEYSDKCNEILEKIQINDWSYKHKDQFNNFYFKVR